MKKLAVAVTLALSPLLGACPGGVNTARPAEQVVMTGTKALIAAQYAYSGVGNLILPLLRNGTIKGADAARVREINARAIKLLSDAKNAKDEFTRAAVARDLLAAVSDLNAFKGN